MSNSESDPVYTRCPNCGRYSEMADANGYCRKACAARYGIRSYNGVKFIARLRDVSNRKGS